MPVVRIRLGLAPDVGWLAGFPGITPLELHGDLFTAQVDDAGQALQALRAAGFPQARLEA
jgi:hypothetical protein